MSANMVHAWRVSRFFGEVSNGGLYDFLANRCEEFDHSELLESVTRVCGERQAAIIKTALPLLEKLPVQTPPEQGRDA